MADKNLFEVLNSIDVSEHIEKKDTGKVKLSYLSWSWAWAEFKKRVPDARYEIKTFENNHPYVFDQLTGYMVFTSVTANGITHDMWLPVMDGNNKAMKAQPYTYLVKDYKTGRMIEKQVASATMFDINKTIMRCLVKNLAMFGLGLYIYSGEDLPEDPEPVEPTPAAKPAPKATKKTAPQPIPQAPQNHICANCNNPVVDAGGAKAEDIAKATIQKYGKPYCKACIDAMKQKQKEETEKRITEAFSNMDVPFEIS